MTKANFQILAQLPYRRGTRTRHIWAAIALASGSLLGMVAAFGTAPGTLDIATAQQSVIEELGPQQPLALERPRDSFVKETQVQRGDTVALLLDRLGIADRGAMEFLRSSREAMPIFRQLSPGKVITARVGTSGDLQSLTFPLNGGADKALYIEAEGDAFKATEKVRQFDTKVVMKAAQISYSLFGATDAADIPDSVAIGLADIFGGDIDFHRDLRKGDRFSVVYEAQYDNGKMMRSGRILAAEFINDGKTYSAIWFETAPGVGGYYTVDGKNIRKAFLRSPLEFSRVTSGFTSARFHPVLKKWRAHKGTDFGAPTGTRVKATGDGTVEFVGTKGGYGKVVVLRHHGQATTLYGHLSRFAPGLKKGSRVSQGDVIGFVGATGLASGPHLHYEFLISGVHKNPLTIALPSAPPLDRQQLARFSEITQPQRERIGLIRHTTLALLD